MEIRILTVGKPAPDFHKTLSSRYIERLGRGWPTSIHSVPEERLTKNRSRGDVLRREGAKLQSRLPGGWPIIALDREGHSIDSLKFAERMRQWQDGGNRGVAFVIGGPEGLDASLVKQADFRMSFGKMTFSHDLALGLLCEQCYRALSIVRGWPYHR
jgi:23S rRNA (pseudouridine1915-N3)-methyltransferase